MIKEMDVSHKDSHINPDKKDQKILVVDDDPASLKLVRALLMSEGYQVETAQSGAEGLIKISVFSPHLVLLDMAMPGIDGIATLKMLRENKDGAGGGYVAVIFLSGHSEIEDVVRGLTAGADDYIAKPFDGQELLARVQAQLRTKILHDELTAANVKLKELVDIDDLTGLFNMRSLYKKLNHEIYRAKRHQRGIGIVMMDIDHFKKVNDHHDHLFGSYCISEMGKIIRENVRQVDFAARYGGDEFLIVLTEIDPPGAAVFMERLRQTVKANSFESGGYAINLTISMGLSVVNPAYFQLDGQALVRHADNALYEAKEAGRDCFRIRNLTPDKFIKGDFQKLRTANLKSVK